MYQFVWFIDNVSVVVSVCVCVCLMFENLLFEEKVVIWRLETERNPKSELISEEFSFEESFSEKVQQKNPKRYLGKRDKRRKTKHQRIKKSQNVWTRWKESVSGSNERTYCNSTQ